MSWRAEIDGHSRTSLKQKNENDFYQRIMSDA